jgi:hypothetical protein
MFRLQHTAKVFHGKSAENFRIDRGDKLRSQLMPGMPARMFGQNESLCQRDFPGNNAWNREHSADNH